MRRGSTEILDQGLYPKPPSPDPETIRNLVHPLEQLRSQSCSTEPTHAPPSRPLPKPLRKPSPELRFRERIGSPIAVTLSDAPTHAKLPLLSWSPRPNVARNSEGGALGVSLFETFHHFMVP